MGLVGAFVLSSTITIAPFSSDDSAAVTQSFVSNLSKQGCEQLRDVLIPNPQSRTETTYSITYTLSSKSGASSNKVTKEVTCTPTGASL